MYIERDREGERERERESESEREREREKESLNTSKMHGSIIYKHKCHIRKQIHVYKYIYTTTHSSPGDRTIYAISV